MNRRDKCVNTLSQYDNNHEYLKIIFPFNADALSLLPIVLDHILDQIEGCDDYDTVSLIL